MATVASPATAVSSWTWLLLPPASAAVDGPAAVDGASADADSSVLERVLDGVQPG